MTFFADFEGARQFFENLIPSPTSDTWTRLQVRNRPAEAGSHQKIGRDSGRSQDEWTGSGRDEPIIAEEREGIDGRPGHFEGGFHSAAIAVRSSKYLGSTQLRTFRTVRCALFSAANPKEVSRVLESFSRIGGFRSDFRGTGLSSRIHPSARPTSRIEPQREGVVPQPPRLCHSLQPPIEIGSLPQAFSSSQDLFA